VWENIGITKYNTLNTIYIYIYIYICIGPVFTELFADACDIGPFLCSPAFSGPGIRFEEGIGPNSTCV